MDNRSVVQKLVCYLGSRYADPSPTFSKYHMKKRCDEIWIFNSFMLNVLDHPNKDVYIECNEWIAVIKGKLNDHDCTSVRLRQTYLTHIQVLEDIRSTLEVINQENCKMADFGWL